MEVFWVCDYFLLTGILRQQIIETLITGILWVLSYPPLFDNLSKQGGNMTVKKSIKISAAFGHGSQNLSGE